MSCASETKPTERYKCSNPVFLALGKIFTFLIADLPKMVFKGENCLDHILLVESALFSETWMKYSRSVIMRLISIICQLV